ncbi:unnamed protein product [Tetraodon nigroviridis]|uniref:(spotted green pufferfish) hypothetical protein n=1 Tax=Tetraodon nigroviridis TaxID=99883 RepID=Q4S5R3_TETNG|nr:unnamed protein product [Tetraodon nigroviridis]
MMPAGIEPGTRSHFTGASCRAGRQQRRGHAHARTRGNTWKTRTAIVAHQKRHSVGNNCPPLQN